MRRTGPDSRDSWWVVMRVFWLSFILFGMMRMSGILFVGCMDRFGASRQQASLPFIVAYFMQSPLSPFSGLLARKYGPKKVVLFGCVLSSVGGALSFFAEDILSLTLLYGILYGSGFGISNGLFPVIISQHFVKQRATALGVSFSGSYFGSFALPILIDYCISTYGVSGTFLWISGITLNCIPFAMGLQDSEKSERHLQKKYPINNNTSHPLECIESRFSKKGKLNIISYCHPIVSSGTFRLTEDRMVGKRNSYHEFESVAVNALIDDENPWKILSVSDLREIENGKNASEMCIDYNESCTNVSHVQLHDTKQLCTSSSRSNLNDRVVEYKTKVQRHLRYFLPCLDPIFVAIVVIFGVYGWSFVAFNTIIVDFTRDIGYPVYFGSYVLMCFFIFCIVGVLCFGWVTDKGFMSLTNFTSLLFFLRGGLLFLIPFSRSFYMLMAVVGLQGLFEASIMNLVPLILAERFTDETQEVAVASVLLMCGPFDLTTPPILGYYRDTLGSYEKLFYLMSILTIVCGILIALIPCFRQTNSCKLYSKHSQEERQNTHLDTTTGHEENNTII